jgi:alpha-tubulin suppressor-like RCC1 family protein
MRGVIFIALCGACGFHSGGTPPDAPPPDSPPPPDAAPTGDWLDVAAYNEHTCAIKLDHTLWCWGDNQSGQLGVGSTENEIPTPTQVGTAQWTQLTAGGYHVCGLQMDGSLWCWGRNVEGELGVDETAGAVAIQRTPARVIPAATFTSVAAGYLHTCAIASDQTLYCWGDDSYGQFGIGSTAGSRAPLQVSTIPTVQIAGGAYQTCAVRADQSLWCSGYNYYGQLGDGSSASTTGGGYHLSPVQVAGTWASVAAHDVTTCAITTDHHLRCWGYNAFGNLGDGTSTDRWVPQAVGADHDDWASVALGSEHTCGTRADGALYCWGDDAMGQIALSEDRALENSNPTLVPGITGVTSIALGGNHSCVVASGHVLDCTGLAALGQLGDGTQSRRAPTRIAGTWDEVSLGAASTCARASSGALSCWGDNTYSQLADGRAVPETTPAASTAPAPGLLATGAHHACDVDSTGAVWCWGYPYYEETGDPNALRMAPGRVAGVTAGALSARDHTCTIPTSGTGLWCWGNNFYAQLGTGTTTQNYLPNNVLTAQTFAAVATGGQFAHGGRGFSCAITASVGVLQCWGDNYYGEVGNGMPNTTTPVTTPAMLAGTWTSVALGSFHACAIAKTGALSCWGLGTSGELGLGSTTSMPSPTTVGSATWTSISLGELHSCGIQSDGSLWCWGWNQRGQLGDGTDVDKNVPTRVGTDVDWIAIAAGHEHTCALKTDKSLWCWGLDDSGQLGDGTAWRSKWAAVP